jgi:hypothetical protein
MGITPVLPTLIGGIFKILFPLPAGIVGGTLLLLSNAKAAQLLVDKAFCVAVLVTVKLNKLAFLLVMLRVEINFPEAKL